MTSTTTQLSLIDQIALDENVVAAIRDAMILACSKVVRDWRPGDSPVGYVPSRAFLEAVTLVTGALRPFGFVPSDPKNQRHLLNQDRYDQPVQFIISSAKEVNGGFQVTHKGPVTLWMVENCGQGTLFDDERPDLRNDPCFWLLFQINEHTHRLDLYLARPFRLHEKGTLLETTEYHPFYGDVIGAPSMAVEDVKDLPVGPTVSLSIEEIPVTAGEMLDETP